MTLPTDFTVTTTDPITAFIETAMKPHRYASILDVATVRSLMRVAYLQGKLDTLEDRIRTLAQESVR